MVVALVLRHKLLPKKHSTEKKKSKREKTENIEKDMWQIQRKLKQEMHNKLKIVQIGQNKNKKQKNKRKKN